MITANFQRDAVHFSAPEKKSKRLLIRNYQLLRSTECRLNRVKECRICSFYSSAEGGMNDSFLTINLRVRGFTSFSRTMPIITNLTT